MLQYPGAICQKIDSAIHRKNLCPVDFAVGFPNKILMVIYPVESAIQLLNEARNTMVTYSFIFLTRAFVTFYNKGKKH